VNAITIGIEADMSIQNDEEEMTWSLSLGLLGCWHGWIRLGHGIWVNYNDLTATSLDLWSVRGIIPKWPYFRLVKYYNLPRWHE